MIMEVVYFLVWYVGSLMWFSILIATYTSGQVGWSFISAFAFLFSAMMIIIQYLHALGL